jgi:hypothetical protein
MCEAFPHTNKMHTQNAITKAVALWMSQLGRHALGHTKIDKNEVKWSLRDPLICVCFIQMHSFYDNAQKRHNLQIVQLHNHECEQSTSNYVDNDARSIHTR